MNTPAQHAAAHALVSDEGESFVARQNASLAAARDALTTTLRDLGFRFRVPSAGYFVLADHRAISEPLGVSDDVAFVEHLINACGVAAIPPSAFYSHADRSFAAPLVRFAFCKHMETIQEAGRRLARLKTPATETG